jgi:hypothetical protein
MALSAGSVYMPDRQQTVGELLRHLGDDVGADMPSRIVAWWEGRSPQHQGILFDDGRVVVLPAHEQLSLENAAIVRTALPPAPTCAAFLPGGDLLAGNADGTLEVVGVEGGLSRLAEPDGSPVVGVFPSSHSALLAVSANGIVTAWSLPALTRIRTLQLPDAVTSASAGDNDLWSRERFVAVGCSDGTVHLLDFTGTTVKTLFSSPLPVSQISLMRSFLAVVSGHEVVVWSHPNLSTEPNFLWALPDSHVSVSAIAQLPCAGTEIAGVDWFMILGYEDGRLLCTAVHERL